jgi:capsular polysaccharide biosynthesis protein
MTTRFRPTIKPLLAFFGICASVFFPIFLFAVLITFLIPEMYAGTATILISRSTSAPDSTWAETEVQVVSSSVVLEQVGKDLDLKVVWGKKYNNGQPLSVSDVVEILKSRLDVFVVKPRGDSTASTKDSVPIRIRAYSDSSEEAARIANGIVEAYRAFRVEENRRAGATSMERTVTILDSALPQYRVVRPNKPLNIIIGAILGMLVAVIIAPLLLGFVAWVRNRRSAPGLPQKA